MFTKEPTEIMTADCTDVIRSLNQLILDSRVRLIYFTKPFDQLEAYKSEALSIIRHAGKVGSLKTSQLEKAEKICAFYDQVKSLDEQLGDQGRQEFILHLANVGDFAKSLEIKDSSLSAYLGQITSYTNRLTGNYNSGLACYLLPKYIFPSKETLKHLNSKGNRNLFLEQTQKRLEEKIRFTES